MNKQHRKCIRYSCVLTRSYKHYQYKINNKLYYCARQWILTYDNIFYAQTYRHTYNQFKITRATTHPTRNSQSACRDAARKTICAVPCRQRLGMNILCIFVVLIRSVALPHYCWVPACNICRRRTTPGNLLHWPWAYLKRNLLILSCPMCSRADIAFYNQAV